VTGVGDHEHSSPGWDVKTPECDLQRVCAVGNGDAFGDATELRESSLEAHDLRTQDVAVRVNDPTHGGHDVGTVFDAVQREEWDPPRSLWVSSQAHAWRFFFRRAE
jgi:hypothetical protein